MKKKLLIISSYGIRCGIAQYVEHIVPVLEREYGNEFLIEVAGLDVQLLKAKNSFALRLASKHINEIVSKAKEADVVNIQLEPGLFGTTSLEIRKRLMRIIKASRLIIITHHTLLDITQLQTNLPLSRKKFRAFLGNLRLTFVLRPIYRLFVSYPKKFFHIVQTELDKTTFERLGIPSENIIAKPLSFIDNTLPRKIINFDKFNCMNLSKESVIIGVFGFLSEYKGIEVAIQALNVLPDNFHLIIVGGMHPNSIQNNTTSQPYIQMLLRQIMMDNQQNIKSKKKSWSDFKKRLKRIHFVGEVESPIFIDYMIKCDIVVLPYAELGQRSSGPASMALDLNKRILCSRNTCFQELNKFASCLEMFEIGNYLELAEKIQQPDLLNSQRHKYQEKYNIINRAKIYIDGINKLMLG